MGRCEVRAGSLVHCTLKNFKAKAKICFAVASFLAQSMDKLDEVLKHLSGGKKKKKVVVCKMGGIQLYGWSPAKPIGLPNGTKFIYCVVK